MAEVGRADGVYEFGDFRLLAAQRRLIARSDGRPIEVTAKALDALHFLLRHPGELLDKSTLMAAVWPNVVVEENNLNQVVSALRRALGDGSGGRRFIVTVPGRGYQFVAPVREVHEKAPSAQSAPPAAHPAQVTPAVRKSIAVLPFASLSSDPEKDYFGDGIAEELIHLLARVPRLKVPARTSSFAYKGRNIDVRQIARELGVGMLLEGSVRSAGERIRVTAQLVEADSGFHVWSETYDRRFVDIFELQDELAGAIVQALKITLGDGEPRSLRDAPPTKSVEAYRLFLQARAMHSNLPSRARLIEWLSASIALDPGFARAHAELAVVRDFLFLIGDSGPEILLEAQRSAEMALSLDPNCAEAHAAMGVQYARRGDWIRAEDSLRCAMELDPAEPLTHNAYATWVLGPAGKLNHALVESRTAYELAPAMTGAATSLAGFSGICGHNEQSARYTQVVVALGVRDDQLPVPIFRSEIARHSGQYAVAAESLIPGLPQELRAHGSEELVGLVYAALGDPDRAPQALAALRRLRKHRDLASLDKWPMIMFAVVWYAWLGALDDAYETAREIAGSFKRTGILNVLNLSPLWMPELLAFRRDARFQDFARELGLIDYWRERGPPEGCELKGERLLFP
jgi:TolB-like protein/Tfp pilus assembly protein PilF